MIVLEDKKIVIFMTPVISEKSIKRFIRLNDKYDSNVIRFYSERFGVVPARETLIKTVIGNDDYPVDTQENGWTWVYSYEPNENVLEDVYEGYTLDNFGTHQDFAKTQDMDKLDNGLLVDVVITHDFMGQWLDEDIEIGPDNNGESVSDWWWKKYKK